MPQSARIFAALAFALLLGTAAESAQTIYRCEVGGKTLYQSEPCPAGGKALPVEPGPTTKEIQEAQTRAINEKNRAAVADAEAATRETRTKAATANRSRDGAATCAALNKQYADAWGRRNAYMRSGSSMPDRSLEDVEKIERDLQRAACKID
jgi:hypothetical protein